MRRKKYFKILKAVLLSFVSLLLCAVLAFYVLIVFGASKRLQTMWVCSAMTTMYHKYLATWFFTDEEIDKIMSENYVDDSEYDSSMTDFNKNEIVFHKPTLLEKLLTKDRSSVQAPDWFNSYIIEGYHELEDGIFLKEVSGTSWKGYVMLIENPMRVKLLDTQYQFDKGQTVKRMVTNSGAIAGLNGGGFVDGANYDSNGGTPAGLVIENGTLISPIQESEIENKRYSMIGINSKGVLVLKHCTPKWALENDIVSAVSFSPFIVVNGEGTVKNGTGGWGLAPRTAIGQRATGEFLFLVIDGRQIGWSIGCDLDVLQEVLLNEKAENGAMLDGGSSTVLFYRGDYINRPSLGHERLINNCFIVTE